MLEFSEFDFMFRKLCHSFGYQYNSDRAKIYFENLRLKVNPKQWREIVHKIISTEDHFPRIAMLLRLANVGKDTYHRFDPEAWVDDDCKVKKCTYGVLHYEKDGHTVAFKCPQCNRANLPSTVAVYQGAVTIYNDEEMRRRREEREYIFKNPDYRRKLRSDVFNEAAEIFSRGLKGRHEETKGEDTPSGGDIGNDHTEADP